MEVEVENDLAEFNAQTQRAAIMAGYVPSRPVDDLVQFEAKRLLAEGATEATAEKLAIISLKDPKSRDAALAALRAEHPSSFIAPAKPGDDFMAQYKRVVKKQSSARNGETRVSGIMRGIEQTKARMAARKGQ